MRVLFALPGLHRHNRGAETAFISIANELTKLGDNVTLIGSGHERTATLYRFIRAASVPREKFKFFPSLPVLRSEYNYEELTFVPDLIRQYRPRDYDVTLTCSYPFTNWVLRRPTLRGCRPPHVFVTENGDWPAYSDNSEYRFFGCEGLVCTNPDFYERNKQRWRCALIPNGVDCDRFRPGRGHRKEFNLPATRTIVLMVSALIPSKRIEVGIKAVSHIPDAHLVVAGNGPLRQELDTIARELLPDRFTNISVSQEKMPELYQCADVFLHLSKDESFGNVFLEAMASGLPIVAHDSPRTRWIVGDDEFLLDTEDSKAIARQIEMALNSPPSDAQKRSMKATAFAWMNIAAKYRTFLQELVSS